MRRRSDDDDELRDESVRVHLMDSRQHQPGYRGYSLGDWETGAVHDARKASRDARAEMIQRAQDAWDAKRRRKPDDDDDNDDDETDPPGKIGQSALSVKVDRKSIADARRAANDSYREMCSRLQSARTASWNAYRANLENAWRGRTDPTAATRIERQGEQWRHGK